ncbi:MAG: bacteriohemerythrin [Desulfuromonadales bacterium]
MSWNPSMSVNVKQFDDQHIRLVDMLNSLHLAMKEGRGHQVLGEVLNELIDYTSCHFADEEQLMAVHDYPEKAQHIQVHQNLVKQVLELQQNFASGRAILTLDVMMFLKEWLVVHIQGVDRKYGAFLNGKGIT